MADMAGGGEPITSPGMEPVSPPSGHKTIIANNAPATSKVRPESGVGHFRQLPEPDSCADISPNFNKLAHY